MNQRLTLFRRDTGSQAMRQSAALTTVYLLELNRKFEAFMREKVDRLEGRVSAQQARQAGRAATEAAWAEGLPVEVETWPAEVQLDEVVPIEPAAGSGEDEPRHRPAEDQTREAAFSEPSAALIETDIPDYAALLIGDPADITAADRSFEMAAAEPAEADETRPEADERPDTVENDEVWADPISTKPPAIWAGPDPEQVEDDTAYRIEETATPDVLPDDDILPGAAKLVLLTGDPRPDAAGIPASELLRDEPEQMISWSSEADLSETTCDDEAGLIEAMTEDTPADRAEAAASAGEAPEMDAEPADWDTVLPAAGQKWNWA